MTSTHLHARNIGPGRKNFIGLASATVAITALCGTIFVTSATPAGAATASPAQVRAAANASAVPASWLFVGIYPTKAACVAAGEGVQGIAGGAKAYKCTEVTTSGVAAWYLYVEY